MQPGVAGNEALKETIQLARRKQKMVTSAMGGEE